MQQCIECVAGVAGVECVVWWCSGEEEKRVELTGSRDLKSQQ